MTAVIYARYSSDNQREESIEGQIRECTAYAEKNGITVVKHYIDRAYSAKTANRPEFQRMVKDSERRLFDIVLVWKLDRFARDRYDAAHYKHILQRNHVKLVSTTEPISDSPAGIMMESMLTGMAEYYSAELSEKVVRGMTENVLKGKYNGGTVPIGYVIDENRFFQIDSLKAPFVVEAFKRYAEGATMKGIMNWLNSQGVTTNRNQKFTYNSVQTLLTNRRYIGENRFQDIVMPDTIPAIVEKKLFARVQEKIAKNRRAPARHKAEDDYLLTTKLFCGMCGAMMFGECGTGRNKVVHHYYKCANAKRTRSCKKKTVRKVWLEDLVVNATLEMLQDDQAIDAIVEMVMQLQDQENTTLPLLEKQLKETETGIQNMLNAIQAGILTSSTKERLEALETQKKELEVRITEEKLAKPKLSADFVRFWLTRFRKLNPEIKSHRETLVNTFVNAIYLYDDKVLLTFNYKEGTKIISLDDVAALAASRESGSDLGCLPPPKTRCFTRASGFSLCFPIYTQTEGHSMHNLLPFHPNIPRSKSVYTQLGLAILAAAIIITCYDLLDRNPCFACIGAVFGMGTGLWGGLHSGINRSIGTLLGGVLALPFYYLYNLAPGHLPRDLCLLAGLFLVIYLGLLVGAVDAVPAGTVVYFVVIFTVPQDRYIQYTIDRILDTSVGALLALGLSYLYAVWSAYRAPDLTPKPKNGLRP